MGKPNHALRIQWFQRVSKTHLPNQKAPCLWHLCHGSVTGVPEDPLSAYCTTCMRAWRKEDAMFLRVCVTEEEVMFDDPDDPTIRVRYRGRYVPGSPGLYDRSRA